MNILFIGGPEHMKWHEIDDPLPTWRVPIYEPLTLLAVDAKPEDPVEVSFKIAEYELIKRRNGKFVYMYIEQGS